MAAPSEIGKRHYLAISEVAEIIERLDPESGERVARANHGPDHGIPSPVKKPLETAAYHAECILALARRVEELKTPRKRGRPPKRQSA